MGLTFVRYAPHKYGRLVLVRRSRSTHKGIFRCTCGAEKEIAFCAVFQGKTRSCGCLQREYLAQLGRNNRENYRAFKAQLIPLSDGLHLSKEERCRAFNFKARVPARGDNPSPSAPREVNSRPFQFLLQTAPARFLVTVTRATPRRRGSAAANLSHIGSGQFVLQGVAWPPRFLSGVVHGRAA